MTTVRSIRQPVASLSGGQRQSVAVAKAVMWNSKLVLLDEPTAALGVVQTRMVLDLVKRLRDRGLAVMVISHNLNDVFEVADRIAVLHLGRMVAEGPAADFDRQSVVEYMTTGSCRRAAVRACRIRQWRGLSPWPGSGNPRDRGPAETPAGTADAAMVADLTAAPEAAAADVPPEILAQSLGQYLRAWWLQVRSGNSGVLPVVLAMVLVAVVFEIITPEHAFLRPSNLVYIFGLSTVYMVLAMAETVVLLLGEIDLSVGAVALIGGVIAFKLVQQPGPGWPWWAAMLAALVCCGVIGALQGTLIARLKIPSFVVTLGGFLLFSGILIVVLGGADGSVNVNTSVPNQRVIYDMVQG